MERQDFLPRTALPREDGLRDLPPTDRNPLESVPTPRMDLAPEGGCGCGCGDHDHDHGHDHDHDCGHNHDHDCGHDHSHDHGNNCGHRECYEGCGEGSWGLGEHPLAMVYAPCQDFRALYDPATALNRGTLFTELDLPLGGAEGMFTTVGCACRAERRKA